MAAVDAAAMADSTAVVGGSDGTGAGVMAVAAAAVMAAAAQAPVSWLLRRRR